MSAVYQYIGDRWFFNTSLAANNTKLHLFTNNVTPAKSDTVGTYTECSASGYSAITLSSGSWTVSTVSTTTTAAYATQTFTLTASATIYGYYITDSGGTNIILSEAFPAVFNIPSSGGSVAITLALTDN
jgi:hypothetical protein